MPRRDRSTQVRISRTTADALRKLAADLGFVQTRGIMAGELGSIAQMFDAVARGELLITPAAPTRFSPSEEPNSNG